MKNNKKAYSVIIAMLLIGFLLVITTTVFSLVLRELRDNRVLGDSIKAFAGAESGQEIALLNIKEQGYGFNKTIDLGTNDSKSILADPTSFHRSTDVMVAYNLDTKAGEYEETLGSQGYSIIPLFYQEGSDIYKISNYSLNIVSGNQDDLVWNLISGETGITGTGPTISTDIGKLKKINANGELSVGSILISDVLDLEGSQPYLILFNTGIYPIKFKVTSSQNFSKPKIQILSSAQVGKVRQSLYTDYDNTEFLNMLKYAALSQ